MNESNSPSVWGGQRKKEKVQRAKGKSGGAQSANKQIMCWLVWKYK